MKELEIYLHIPFCIRKCQYCDFLSFSATKEERCEYLCALKKEIADFPYHREYRVTTVFWGGGTPSVLSGEEIAEVMDLLREKFIFDEKPEISMECNPGTASRQSLKQYKETGINRLSLGLQSANQKELQLLGRIHTWETFLECYSMARETGFSNINVDLMSALPGQTLTSWEKTLEQVLQLKPEHISAYSLIIEEGTPFFIKYGEDARRREMGEQPLYLPSEEVEREMYIRTEEILLDAGMHRYEISNYALSGFECRHNTGYWIGTDYVGFGLGASSFLRPYRYRNPDQMQEYLRGDFRKREKEILSERDQMEEFMFLGLRMMAGVSEQEFQNRFTCTIDEIYGKILFDLQQKGLIERSAGRIALTRKGIDVSNWVMSEFLF